MTGRPASVSLVIPAYNEEAAIESVIDRAAAVLARTVSDHELIVLDDASTDGTWAVIERARQRCPSMRTERHATNQGIAATFEDLYRLASKDFVFLISGDGQFPPETLEKCTPLLDRYDIIICKRVVKQYTPYRHAISFAFRWVPKLLFGVDAIDPGGIKCMKREIIQQIPVQSTSVFVESERIIRAVKRGYRLTSVDMEQAPRIGGQAKGARLSTLLGAVRDMTTCWWRLSVLRRPA